MRAKAHNAGRAFASARGVLPRGQLCIREERARVHALAGATGDEEFAVAVVDRRSWIFLLDSAVLLLFFCSAGAHEVVAAQAFEEVAQCWDASQ